MHLFKKAKGRIYFLNRVLEFWKRINVHLKFTAPQTQNNLRTVITFSDDNIIQKLRASIVRSKVCAVLEGKELKV